MDILEQIANSQIENSKDKSIKVSGTITSSNVKDSVNIAAGVHDAIAKGITAGATNIQVADGYFGNSLERTGKYAPHTMAGHFDYGMITFQRNEILTLYHSCWELRKGIDKIAEDMWSRGVEIQDQEDPTKMKRLYSWFSKQTSEMIFATEQARLFGGAVTLMMVDDGEKDLSKPLKLSKVKAGSRVAFYTTDRWYGVEQSMEKVTDFQSEEFGLPMYYHFQIDGVGERVTVHHSRVLRWVNKRSPRMVEVQLQGWGVSELESVLQDLMNYVNVKNSSASIVNKALIEIFKLKGLRGVMTGLSGGNASASAVLSGQMAAINNFRNSNGVALIDSSDSYEKHEANFSGLSDLLAENRPIVAGAFNMPQYFLYGDLKSGVFNSEESPEARMYEQFIQTRKEEMLYRNVRKLLILGAKITNTKLGDDFDFDFVPLYDRSEKARQDELNSLTDTVIKLIDSSLMTHETGFLEVQAAQKRTGFGVHLEDRDLQLAKRADKEALANPQGEGTDEDAQEGELDMVTNPDRMEYNSLFGGGN